ncbi:hypothetical protein ACFL10_01135 [Patescibacteria group bacterium]
MLDADPNLKRLEAIEDLVGQSPKEVTVFIQSGKLAIRPVREEYLFIFEGPRGDEMQRKGGVLVNISTGEVRHNPAETQMNAFLQQQGSPTDIADAMIEALQTQ